MYIKELKKKSCDFSKNTNQPIFSQAKSVPYLVFVFTKLHLIFSFYPNTISQQDDLACWNVKTVYTKFLNTKSGFLFEKKSYTFQSKTSQNITSSVVILL